MRGKWIAFVMVLGACSDRSAIAVDDGAVDKATVDAVAPKDTSPPDRALDQPADQPTDKLNDQTPDHIVGDAAEPDACHCKPGEAWANHACVATTNIGCTPTCDPTDPSSCPLEQKCDKWGGAACCVCAQALPVCIPSPSNGPSVLEGPLRISPVSGQAGQSVTINVEGARFNVGALFYKIRMGTEEAMANEHMKMCSTSATFTPPSPGMYAVEVSQYGGGEPWVLAGFYVASGGSIPPPTIQPGLHCSPNDTAPDLVCAQANPYNCSCVAGRCACSK